MHRVTCITHEPCCILTYADLLYFTTGCDRIPTYGFEKLFEKKIEVIFDDVSLPKVSTCRLILTLPNNSESLSNKMLTAIRYGGGFGLI